MLWIRFTRWTHVLLCPIILGGGKRHSPGALFREFAGRKLALDSTACIQIPREAVHLDSSRSICCGRVPNGLAAVELEAVPPGARHSPQVRVTDSAEIVPYIWSSPYPRLASAPIHLNGNTVAGLCTRFGAE